MKRGNLNVLMMEFREFCGRVNDDCSGVAQVKMIEGGAICGGGR